MIFREDEENISITEDDDVDLLDTNDVDLVRTIVVDGHGLDVEDDVWGATFTRLRLVDDQPIWALFQSNLNPAEPIVEDFWADVVRKRLVVEQFVRDNVQLKLNQSPHILKDGDI
ncbi:hypothetical protein V6N13_074462 [Hibiscus sabdariffa]|uniref:Uncharacterized protein n=1 Tax=Hibiscus sabdariffa TaxID=183260 RepID=A0ABR2U8F8_9ROSI